MVISLLYLFGWCECESYFSEVANDKSIDEVRHGGRRIGNCRVADESHEYSLQSSLIYMKRLHLYPEAFLRQLVS